MEYDGVDWQRREWVAVYSRRTFRVFLVERTLVWAPRNYEGKDIKWPALVNIILLSFSTYLLDGASSAYLTQANYFK